MKQLSLSLLSLFFLSGCTQAPLGGIFDLIVIQATGPSCQYQVGPASVQTLENLSELKGLLGQVVSHPEDLESNADILDLGLGFRPMDLRMSGSGNTYGPLDKSTLLGFSLYYSIEKAHFLFKTLDPSADLTQIVPNMKGTLIVENAKLKHLQEASKNYTDNAAYLQVEGSLGDRDYFLHFPNETISAIPLGLNPGVLAHEYSHMVTQYLFHNRRSQSAKELDTRSENILDFFEEGLADYFGFLASQDPSFFHCSFPGGTDRDLSHPKTFTSQQADALRTGLDFDSHEGGAVWASVQYQIGQRVGHEANARSLIRFLSNLASCTGLSSSRTQVTVNAINNCHIQALGTLASPQIQQIYQSAFGVVGGN